MTWQLGVSIEEHLVAIGLHNLAVPDVVVTHAILKLLQSNNAEVKREAAKTLAFLNELSKAEKIEESPW